MDQNEGRNHYNFYILINPLVPILQDEINVDNLYFIHIKDNLNNVFIKNK